MTFIVHKITPDIIPLLTENKKEEFVFFNLNTSVKYPYSRHVYLFHFIFLRKTNKNVKEVLSL